MSFTLAAIAVAAAINAGIAIKKRREEKQAQAERDAYYVEEIKRQRKDMAGDGVSAAQEKSLDAATRSTVNATAKDINRNTAAISQSLGSSAGVANLTSMVSAGQQTIAETGKQAQLSAGMKAADYAMQNKQLLRDTRAARAGAKYASAATRREILSEASPSDEMAIAAGKSLDAGQGNVAMFSDSMGQGLTPSAPTNTRMGI